DPLEVPAHGVAGGRLATLGQPLVAPPAPAHEQPLGVLHRDRLEHRADRFGRGVVAQLVGQLVRLGDADAAVGQVDVDVQQDVTGQLHLAQQVGNLVGRHHAG